MYTKQNLLDAVSNEFRILKHLVEKIPAGTENYKPTDGQRTTLELLQYMGYMWSATVKVILNNDTNIYKEYNGRATETTLANFGEMLDKQDTEIREMLKEVTDEDLSVIVNIYNQGDKTKGVYLTESLLKWIAAYKMQLFLYIKSSGNTDIGTSNLWGGMDMPAK